MIKSFWDYVALLAIVVPIVILVVFAGFWAYDRHMNRKYGNPLPKEEEDAD